MSSIFIPRILECLQLVAESNSKAERIANDYELDFYVSGTRRMIINDVEYPISMGSLAFKRPGDHVVSYGDYNCYIMTFDISGELNISPSKYLRTRAGDFQKQTPHLLLDDFPAVFTPRHYEDILKLFESLNNNTYPFPENKELTDKLLKELLLLISADIVSDNIAKEQKHVQQDYVTAICEYINKNYYNPIRIEDLANLVSLNPNYLIRLFREKTHSTPIQYLHKIRMFHAQRLLCESSIPVAEVAYRCGFDTPAYFTKYFKEKFGKTPSAFRR